jgi:hypothetical protein
VPETSGFVKVYLTSSTSAKTVRAATSLASGGLELLLTDQVGSARGWLTSLAAAIAECDAVVAVVAPPVSDAMLIEIGVAIGQRVPVVIVVESDEERQSLPVLLRELPVIMIGGDTGAFVERITATIQSLAASVERSVLIVEGRTDAEYLTAVLGRLPEQETARLAAAAFARAGGTIYPEMTTSDESGRRIDFAVWLPGPLEAAFNPVVVEVKQIVSDDSIAQVEAHLHALDLVLGLLVSVDDVESMWHIGAKTA